MTDVVEAEAVEDTGSSAPAVIPGPANLFAADDPVSVLGHAQAVADALMPVVTEKKLISTISGRDYLRVEAWTTLGAMLGVTPVCVWTKMLKDGWEARVEARTLDGRVVGAAESECLRSEKTWADRDDYALRSMAQTRATSKALSSVLRFVATLAGVQGTPAEEIVADAPGVERAAEADQKAAKKALGRLLGPGRADDALTIWTAALIDGVCPSVVAQLLITLDEEVPR